MTIVLIIAIVVLLILFIAFAITRDRQPSWEPPSMSPLPPRGVDPRADTKSIVLKRAPRQPADVFRNPPKVSPRSSISDVLQETSLVVTLPAEPAPAHHHHATSTSHATPAAPSHDHGGHDSGGGFDGGGGGHGH